MIGALAFIAMSWIFTIFCAWVSDSDPPNTVKSLAKTNSLRPLTVPQPVTTPSPGTFDFSMPNSTERCSTNMSNSSNDPLSSRSSMRSRAVSLPRACCASMRFSPPPRLALFTGMTLLYAVWGGSWWIYAILFLVPDLSFAGYLAGPRAGAIVYNAAHSYMAPMTLMVTGFAIEAPLVLSIAMIWLAHIGIDRALGYGMKYVAGFGFTHLGRIGRAA